MSITYKVASKRPRGINPESPLKFYPVLTGRRAVDLYEVCELISTRSTFSPPDVIGVVQSLIELVPDLLKDGHNVRLDGFGTFSVHAQARGKNKAEDVSHQDIEGLKMSFLPAKKIKNQLKQAKFTKRKET